MSRAYSIIYTSIVMIIFSLLATPAGAITLVNNRTDWLAQTSNVTTITFENLAPASYPGKIEYDAAGITLNGVNFVGVTADGNYFLEVVNPVNGIGNWGSGDYMAGGWATGYILATLPGSGARAVGVDLMTYPAAHNVTVTLSSGDSYTVPTSAVPTRTFFGFVSDSPITSVAISGSGGYAEIDNFSFDSVPEPDTVFLGAIGLAGLWLARRLRLSR